MITVDGDDAHLAYTWDRKKIRHRYFSGAWLKHALSKIQTQEQETEAQRSEVQ
jgi:dephospho-CoA kinase